MTRKSDRFEAIFWSSLLAMIIALVFVKAAFAGIDPVLCHVIDCTAKGENGRRHCIEYKDFMNTTRRKELHKMLMESTKNGEIGKIECVPNGFEFRLDNVPGAKDWEEK